MECKYICSHISYCSGHMRTGKEVMPFEAHPGKCLPMLLGTVLEVIINFSSC